MRSAQVFLVGPRGCGKSAAGALAAKMLGLPFHDCDLLLEAAAGRTIRDLVRQAGWGEFRRLEAEILRGLAAVSGIVATGGGAVLSEANRLLMRDRGLVLYLEAQADVLRLRLERDPDPERRPALTKAAPEDEPAVVLAERAPLYRDLAHHIIDASLPLPAVAGHIASLVRAGGAKAAPGHEGRLAAPGQAGLPAASAQGGGPGGGS